MARSFTAASSQYLSATSAVATSPPLTLAAWARMTNTATQTGRDIVALSSKTGRSIYRLNWNGFNNPPIRAMDQGSASASAYFGTPTVNTFFHVAGVFTSSSSRTPYFNGSAGITNTDSVPHSLLPDTTSVSAFFDGNSTPLQFFLGDIAEVGIWNAALTAAEIASLAKGMTCDKVRPQSLVFYAPLVRDLIDQKGGLTITNNNGATVANHPRVYA